ncbi:hypothetical protein K505DRAFT_31075 [Melanomma pulvis-pyrius CBS 109.77]|uniref:Uncharacterized protein n=1 Tax=Melanomma pulvis-pyrius CBS 109.77 TaxID=1314802 RepID=A0A6A6XCR6_9PLEO|nr:hypothetical protein K505DRAFT_31075 [Melanomma pulvis-pyrius CBS 109.77]
MRWMATAPAPAQGCRPALTRPPPPQACPRQLRCPPPPRQRRPVRTACHLTARQTVAGGSQGQADTQAATWAAWPKWSTWGGGTPARALAPSRGGPVASIHPAHQLAPSGHRQLPAAPAGFFKPPASPAQDRPVKAKPPGWLLNFVVLQRVCPVAVVALLAFATFNHPHAQPNSALQKLHIHFLILFVPLHPLLLTPRACRLRMLRRQWPRTVVGARAYIGP